jgi:hypothetical protein
MSDKVLYVTPDQTVDECMAIMTERHFRHLPVLDDDHTLLGIVSIGDVGQGKRSARTAVHHPSSWKSISLADCRMGSSGAQSRARPTGQRWCQELPSTFFPAGASSPSDGRPSAVPASFPERIFPLVLPTLSWLWRRWAEARRLLCALKALLASCPAGAPRLAR